MTKQNRRDAVFLLFGWLAACLPVSSYAEVRTDYLSKGLTSIPGELLLFPELTSINRFDQGPAHRFNDNQVIPGINLFYTLDYQRFRFLGEWWLTTQTHTLERLQLGWRWGDTSIWLGRFHNPIGYWNLQYHHSAFLQTTISRPGIMAFESADGPIASHTTGLLVEGLKEFGTAGLYYSLSAGAGPVLKDRLRPLDLLDPGNSYRPSVNFRLGYQPVSYGPQEFGFSIAYNEIGGARTGLNTVKQAVAGVYGNWVFDWGRALSEVIYVHNWLDRPQGQTDHGFVNAYGQLEWDLRPAWTLYGRVEGTFGDSHDPYLQFFPKFVEDRYLGGIRYKFTSNMALKLEVSQEHVRDDRFGQVMLQWSAVLP